VIALANAGRFDDNSVSMKNVARLFAPIPALAILFGGPPAMAASPSPELVNLERQVSLELAHIRDSGPTDPAQRKQLFEASQMEQKGEAAIESGDYKSAEDSLLKAQAILRQFSE
jgi:hypothetical protein